MDYEFSHGFMVDLRSSVRSGGESMTKGKKVVMNDKYHVSEKNKGKVFEVVSEPYSVCGTMVVKLEGFSGCYALDGLTEVRE